MVSRIYGAIAEVFDTPILKEAKVPLDELAWCTLQAMQMQVYWRSVQRLSDLKCRQLFRPNSTGLLRST